MFEILITPFFTYHPDFLANPTSRLVRLLVGWTMDLYGRIAQYLFSQFCPLLSFTTESRKLPLIRISVTAHQVLVDGKHACEYLCPSGMGLLQNGIIGMWVWKRQIWLTDLQECPWESIAWHRTFICPSQVVCESHGHSWRSVNHICLFHTHIPIIPFCSRPIPDGHR